MLQVFPCTSLAEMLVTADPCLWLQLLLSAAPVTGSKCCPRHILSTWTSAFAVLATEKLSFVELNLSDVHTNW